MKFLLIEALPTTARGSTIRFKQPLEASEKVSHSDDGQLYCNLSVLWFESNIYDPLMSGK